MDFETAKTIDENWEQYVLRLVDRNYLTPKDHEKWRAGKSRKWTRKIQVTRFDVVLRIRMVKRKKKQVEQVYSVVVPVAEYVKATIKLPKPQALPDDSEFEGFLDLKGEPIVTRPAELTKTQVRNRERELKRLSPEKRLKKSATESWEKYVDRLVGEKFLTGAQRKSWQLGKAITVAIQIPQTVMIPQTQLRDNKEVTIEIPVYQTKTVEIKLPAAN